VSSKVSIHSKRIYKPRKPKQHDDGLYRFQDVEGLNITSAADDSLGASQFYCLGKNGKRTRIHERDIQGILDAQALDPDDHGAD
jgi:hypothetical protein|tara:strand:+ start:161 stop:412 length:252 start_codon:yes stop_codon:yes gene_type:complete